MGLYVCCSPGSRLTGLVEYVIVSCVHVSRLGHTNIIRFIDLYEDTQFLYVIMEKCDGGEVFEKIVRQKRFTESEMVSFCRQMFSAIEYIHSLGIIHRDIKAENFLYTDEGTVKLIDFGLAVKLKNTKHMLNDIVGSPHYMAPEMLTHKYSLPVDMWSAGVLIYLMLYGRYPFNDETDELIMRKVRQGIVDWTGRDFPLSQLVLEFVQQLLEPLPEARLSPLDALNHEFLRHKSTSEQTDTIAVSEAVIEQLNTSVVMPRKDRRKELLESDSEKQRSARILDLESQFDAGHHRGWRKSQGVSMSAPSSPNKGGKMLKRQATKGRLGHQLSDTTMHSAATDSPKMPKSKRSRSLPEAHVTFDSKPPDVFLYNQRSGQLTRMGSGLTRKTFAGNSLRE